MPPKHGLQTMASTVGLLRYKKIQICNEKALFWMVLPSQKDLELLALSSLARSSGQLPKILSLHIYMMEPLMYACMPQQGWKPLRIWYDLMCKQWGCFSLGFNHRCYVNRMDRTYSRAQLFDASKKGKPAKRNQTLPS